MMLFSEYFCSIFHEITEVPQSWESIKRFLMPQVAYLLLPDPQGAGGGLQW
jgi:hypothetical protein